MTLRPSCSAFSVTLVGPCFSTLVFNFTDLHASLCRYLPLLDNHIPLEGRTKLRNALNEAGITHSWLELAWVQHAYIRDELSKGRYDSAAARVTFELMFDLFFRKLYIEGAGSGAKL